MFSRRGTPLLVLFSLLLQLLVHPLVHGHEQHAAVGTASLAGPVAQDCTGALAAAQDACRAAEADHDGHGSHPSSHCSWCALWTAAMLLQPAAAPPGLPLKRTAMTTPEASSPSPAEPHEHARPPPQAPPLG